MIILKIPAYSAAGCLILILNILRESFLQSPTSTIFTSALPITSKPIDGTAEKLAWQAWVKLPQEQKKQEKTRKVTPKSIFTLPVRNCPLGYKELESRCNNDCVPGQHVQSLCVKDCPLGYTDDNLRCILECAPDQPTKDCTFSIDPEELIKLELDFIAGTSINEYDYDDDETQTDLIPQKLSAETVLDHSNNTFQKATLDEPLKFNIFEQKFPTDYGNGGTVIEDEMLEFDNNTQTLYESSTLLTINRDDTSPNLNVTKTLSTFTKNITNSKETNSKESLRLESTDHSDLSSIINVISVPAGPTAPTANTGIKENEHYLLINDDSSIQIIQSSVTPQNEHKRVYPTLQEEMHQLFKDDQLLPLNNGNVFKINQNQVKNFTRNYTGDTFYEESVAETSKPIILVDNIRMQTAPITVSENTGGIKSKEKQSSNTVDTENESKKNEHTRSLTTSKLSPEVYGQTPALDFTTTEPESTTNTELPETNTEEYNAPTTLLLEVVSEYPLTQSGFIKFSDGETHTVQKKANVDSVEEREGPTSALSKNTSAFATQTRKDDSLTSVLFPLARYSASHTQITTTLPTSLHQQNDRFYYENFQDIISHDLSNTDTQPPTNEKDIIDQKRSSNLLNENEKKFDLRNPVTASSSQPLTTTVDINTTDEENVNKELRIINDLVKIKHKPSETTTVTARGLNQLNSLNEKSSSLGVNVLQTTLKPYTTSSKGLRTSGENGYYPSSQITAGAISTPPTQTKISLSSKKTAALNESLNLNKTSGAVKENLSLRTSNDKEVVLSSARNLRNSKIIRNKTVIPPNAVDERISAKQVLNEKRNVNSSSIEKTSTTEDNSPTFDPFWWLPVGWQLDSAPPQTKNDSIPFFFKFWSVLPDLDSQSSSNTQTPK